MDKAQKIGIAVGATLIAGGIAFPCIWTGVNWKKVHEIDPHKIYRQEDLEKAKQSGYDEAFADKVDLNEKIYTYEQKILELTTQITSLTSAKNQLQAQYDELVKTNNNNVETLNALKNKIDEMQNDINYYAETLAALEIENKAILTFKTDAESNDIYKVLVVDKNTNLSNVPEISKPNYNFVGWTDGENIVNFAETPITADATFIAKFEIKKFAVKFMSENEQYGGIQNIEYNATANEPTAPTKQNYSFVGWTLDGVNIISLDNIPIVEDTTFIAKFEFTAGLIKNNEVVYTWTEMLSNNFIDVNNGVLTYGSDRTGLQALSGNLKIPEGVTRIENYTFQNCKINSVTLPESLESIGYSAFEHSYIGSTLNIPQNVSTIEEYAFCWCNFLKRVNFAENSKIKIIPKYAFKDCSKLFSINFAEGLEEIHERAFYGCDDLTKIIIPSSIKHLYNGIFAYSSASSLEFIMLAETPPVLLYNIFDDGPQNFTIKVPITAVSAYKASSNWKFYKNNIMGYLEVNNE